MSETMVDAQLPLLSRSNWVTLVRQHVHPEMEPQIRRRQRRYYVDTGFVQLVFYFRSPTGGEAPVLREGALLQVSVGGLMVRSLNAIPIDTAVGLCVQFDGHEFALCGRVAHCTQSVSGHKIGIELIFPD